MVVVSDLHLGKIQDTVPKNGLPSRLYDAAQRFIEVLHFADQHDEPVVVAGDVFDSSHPSPYMIDVLLDCLRQADVLGVPVYLLTGNHDCGVQHHSLEYLPNLGRKAVLVDQPTMTQIDGISVLFLPHMVRSLMEKAGDYTKAVQKKILSKKTPQVIIGHTHVTGAKNTSDIEIEAGDAVHFDPTEYPKCLCVFGHIHKHQVLRDRIVYTGPVVTNSFDEAEQEKGFVWVKKDLSWEFVPFTTPETEYKHVTIDLVSKDTLDLNPYKVRELVSGKLLKVTAYAKDAMQIDKTEICKKFNEFGQVVRFEVVICNEMGMIPDDAVNEVLEQIEYKPVFKSYVESKELPPNLKDLALQLGNDVIEEVLNASRA